MNDINDLMLIASIERRTFYGKENISGQSNQKAYVKFRTQLFFVDNYTGKDVYPYELRHDPNGFSHGGNVWQMIKSFREFIITGNCGELRDSKEIWAYSYNEGCMKIRNKGKAIGFVESIVYPYC
ncbi:hypothetical protein AU385_18105 [Bacillus halotolerans]|uniref:hypothetical protein n=1 Tax=Bacillus halotolerans TaxID=260554 RepID=UPI00075006D5|nr:hypothetical protein [Bacillus halotolerans]KUP30325.1 hypothetical protein AU385_18105 [Bacillus halotolerans]